MPPSISTAIKMSQIVANNLTSFKKSISKKVFHISGYFKQCGSSYIFSKNQKSISSTIADLQMLKSRFCSWLAIFSYLDHRPLMLSSMEVVFHHLKISENLNKSNKADLQSLDSNVCSFQLFGSSSIQIVWHIFKKFVCYVSFRHFIRHNKCTQSSRLGHMMKREAQIGHQSGHIDQNCE